MLHILLLFNCISPILLEIACPVSEKRNSRDHCVHLETRPMTWKDAEGFCSARGGHLTSIHNLLDNRINQDM
ncbi:hypothetical protein KIN20_005896 [Parelaphostrongylus tenuis]|uniref:C-type lectin domain-containing protein n=1 Tax=Parelaphostrongylus tenuis TaxID=148309 RepID=A0AAD5M3Z3_PARTN|nr:hypothetical protein KIN20_005896 [Parelaphostrongylus tenuis]